MQSVIHYPLSMEPATMAILSILDRINSEKYSKLVMKYFTPNEGWQASGDTLDYNSIEDVFRAIICLNIGNRLNNIDCHLKNQLSKLKQLYPNLINF